MLTEWTWVSGASCLCQVRSQGLTSVTPTSCSPGCVSRTALGPMFISRGTSWTSSPRSTAWGPGCVSRSMARAVHVCMCAHMSPSCPPPPRLSPGASCGGERLGVAACSAGSEPSAKPLRFPSPSLCRPSSLFLFLFCCCFNSSSWTLSVLPERYLVSPLRVCAPAPTLFTAPQQDRAQRSLVVQAQGLCPPPPPSKAPALFCPPDGDFCPLELLLILHPRTAERRGLSVLLCTDHQVPPGSSCSCSAAPSSPALSLPSVHLPTRRDSAAVLGPMQLTCPASPFSVWGTRGLASSRGRAPQPSVPAGSGLPGQGHFAVGSEDANKACWDSAPSCWS
nr:neuronal PAS domain-containing protein 4-like [Aotus nancymaae]